jgi:probable F420-dependent oxidoreductase|uniref:TIGR03842 family LLM class F420-dependent oxidoreductase n=1 Tax=Candidatus Limnocylindrus sp. TaxID=2802978 RepID=UPI0040494D37
MQFGFTLKPSHSIEQTLELTRRAEALGFEYGWLFDSHVLWRDPYPLLTLMIGATSTMRFGTCVTNPATREPSVTASSLAVLNELSGGRMDLGIGRGDSAIRVLGKGPTSMKDLEETVRVVRALVEGQTVEYEGSALKFDWVEAHHLPVWIAGYGPMALGLAGRVADGALLQIGDPDLIRWFAGQVHDAAAASGRTTRVKVMAAAPSYIGDAATGRERIRWFPALVGNHVVDLISKYKGDLPESLTRYVRNREGYNYLHHAEVGSSNASFVTDDIVERFGLLGSVEDHVKKLLELRDAGVDQFNLYLMNGDEAEQLELFGNKVIPAYKAAAAATSR